MAVFLRDGRRRRVAAMTWLVVAGCYRASGEAAASQSHIELLRREQVSAPHPTCAAGTIPFVRIRQRELGMEVSGRPSVHLRKVFALQVSRPELFRFQHYEAGNMSGTLSDGCPFEFWWAGNPGGSRSWEVRILSTVAPLDPRYAFLRVAPDPPPSWTPAFEGYRHVMSSPIYSDPTYIGLWNRTDGRPGSLVATFNVSSSAVSTVGTSNWTYDGIYHHFAIHRFFFTLVDVPEGSALLYIATFEQEQPRDICCPRRRRR
jgi:hypothetical protein